MNRVFLLLLFLQIFSFCLQGSQNSLLGNLPNQSILLSDNQQVSFRNSQGALNPASSSDGLADQSEMRIRSVLVAQQRLNPESALSDQSPFVNVSEAEVKIEEERQQEALGAKKRQEELDAKRRQQEALDAQRRYEQALRWQKNPVVLVINKAFANVFGYFF